MSSRELIAASRTWVVKLGSSLLTDDGRGLDRSAIATWVQQLAQLSEQGYQIVLVSSGAVAAGMTRLGWQERPNSIHELQAAAAVGQMGLVQAYEEEFQRYGLQTAQVLLDHDDLSNRKRYLNARSALKTLLALNVIPVVNENDTVVTDEIRFGDNDTLAALVANLMVSEALVILTDQPGVFTQDPRTHGDAELITERPADDPSLDGMAAGKGGHLGRGGMISKIRAARLAARSGASTIVAGGRLEQVLLRIAEGEAVGTLLYANQQPMAARKRWLAGQLQTRGTLILDNGAVKVLQHAGKSLLPVGVKDVHGRFKRGDMVICRDLAGNEIARGLINYDYEETSKIMGQSSEQIQNLLGYKDDDELIHRDNLVLI